MLVEVIHEVKSDRMGSREECQGYSVCVCPDCNIAIVNPYVDVALVKRTSPCALYSVDIRLGARLDEAEVRNGEGHEE